MFAYARPEVVVSQCLGFAACRWNGETVREDLVERLSPWVQWRPVCPEMAIGLGVPRDPLRVVRVRSRPHLLQPATGRDHTKAMQDFCASYLDALGTVDGFLLKSRSPSCGPAEVKIYTSPKPGASSRRGAGFFGGAVTAHYPLLAVEHEGRLRNFLLRERWLTRLFTLAEFREVAAKDSMGELVQFHTRHKLLLMAYNQNQLRRMGPLVANPEHYDPTEVIDGYDRLLGLALARTPSPGNVINILMHAMGYFKQELKAAEKALFLEVLDQYRAKKAPLAVAQTLLRSWIARFGSDYLAGQSFFAPYPGELMDITDSGKGRDY